MKVIISVLALFLTLQGYSQPAPGHNAVIVAETPVHCLNEAEKELASAINAYRNMNKLAPVPLSVSLSQVARLHVLDLSANHKIGSRCNMHSWSSDPRWSSCCYTDDHRRASCMWDKPRELTSYTGDGFEIAFYSNHDYASERDFALDALEGWKSSRGHHELIINRGKWKTADWKAMGVGVYDGYAVIWFGEVPDPEGVPAGCSDE
ncbi:CAP domain-containing protein [Lentimicrobium sp.]|uniref:CAP domain-containing protein n=1 Tax=Lentimicrobium sp. TaxID=2034841 RepID=UPI002BD0BBD1|nr:CAP domain-containing protein [Lentimicrobium sp.]HPF63657.1 CAP domain-containing protein [Lentimicrobium sp.]HRW68509.1 CAP domain-containing protein [Lentimicrobium sp.]